MNKHARAVKQLTELARVSPIVVAQRTTRMPQNARTSQREAQLMVQEKVSATAESMLGMTMTALRVQTQFTALLMRPWFAAGGIATKGGSGLTSLMQSSAADLSTSAVSPFLRRAKANAKRLAR